jgi:hypothetical protein
MFPLRARLILAALFLPVLASGQNRDLTVSVSPLHLVFPILQVTAEYRFFPQVSLAAIGGWGSVSITEDDEFDVGELGGQARYYPFKGRRHEPHAGVEVMKIWVSDEPNEGTLEGFGSALALGPFLGYKYTASQGFTLDSQIGYSALVLEVGSETGDRGSAAAGILLVNLNLGWSF